MAAQESNPQLEIAKQPIDTLAEKISSLVLSGNEQPDVEMKKHINLSENYDISEFIKDIQSIANSPIIEDKLYIIGADKEDKRFLPVPNIDGFDEDKIRKLLDKYLAPQITFKKHDILLNREDLSKGSYVAISIPKTQNPPYIVIKNLTYQDGKGKDKLCLRQGDCWVRSGGSLGSTGRRLALREDYDRIYKEFIEVNTEKRLHARLQVIKEERQVKEPIVETNALTHINEKIIYEDVDKFTATIESWMSNAKTDYMDFVVKKICVLIQKEWEKTRHRKGIGLEEIEELTYNVKYNILIPSLTKLFHMCSLFIQYDRCIDMFEKICNSVYKLSLLSKDFPGYGVFRIPNRKYPNEHLSWTLIAFETAIIIEALGALCISFKNYRFLDKLINSSIHLVYDEDGYRMKEKVIIFRSFYNGYGEPDYQRQGFTEYVNRRALTELGIERYIFHTDNFLSPLCQYECILEMNSYGLIKFISGDFKWTYYADFYRYDQPRIYPFIFEAIMRKHDKEFYNNILFNQLKNAKDFNFEKFLTMYLQYLPWYRRKSGFIRYGGWWDNTWPDEIQRFIDESTGKYLELKDFHIGKEK